MIRKVKLLMIDEIQNLFDYDQETQRDILNGLKKLTNQSQTRIIMAGTPSAGSFFRSAEWVEERFLPLTLPEWHINKEYLDLLYSIHDAYCEHLPNWDLVSIDGTVNKKIALLLHELSEGRLGKLIQIIQRGIIRALLKNRTNVIKSDYKYAFHRSTELMIEDLKLDESGRKKVVV